MFPLFKVVLKAQRFLVKGSGIFKEVWVWLTLSQVVRAAWAAAAFPIGFLEFVVDATAAAASAGAWIVLSFPEGVYGAAAAWMSVVTLGGSLSTSFQLMVIVFAGTAMFSSVFLFCGRTAPGIASGCGTLVFAAAALKLPDLREVAYSLLVGSFAVLYSAAASVGFLTFVVDNLQRVDVVQQQAAAAGGHCAFQAKATPRVDVGDPLGRQASFRQRDRTKLKVRKVQKHKSSKSLSRTWLERWWWCGSSPGWTRCLWSSVMLCRSLCSSLSVLLGRCLRSSTSGRCHTGAEWDWARLLTVHVCAAKGRGHEAASPTCARLLDLQ